VGAGTLRFALGTAASLLFGFAPHAAADAYQLLTGERVWEQPWPAADQTLLERDTLEIVCQVNGKLRDRIQAPAHATEAEVLELARAAPNIRAHLDGKVIVKEIYVPGKLVNFVVR
jgi:leucyl-tRNA synthetase